MKRAPLFPSGVLLNGTEYHYEDEVAAYEEARRTKQPAATIRNNNTMKAPT